MDNAGDSSPFLKYFDGDRTHNNFFLQQHQQNGVGEEAMTEEQYRGLNVEPIFTEIDAGNGWPVEGLPVLLNGSLISEGEDQPIESAIADLDSNNELLAESEKVADTEDLENIAAYAVSEIPGKGFLTADGLFLSQELFIQLNLQNETAETRQEVMINPKTFSPTKRDRSIGCKKEIDGDNDQKSSGQIIQLVDTDGTVVNIDRTLLTTGDGSDKEVESENPSLSDLFEFVMARRCKKCSFLCESEQDILRHVTDNHPHLLGDSNGAPIVGNKKPQVKKLENCWAKLPFYKQSKDSNTQTVYLCSECNVGCSSKEIVREHMIFVHNLVSQQQKIVPEMASDNIEEKVECNGDSNCENDTSISSIRHFGTTVINRQLKALKKVKCTITGCELKFATDQLRLKHEKCHIDGQQKKFQCTVCNMKFSLWRICSAHMWKSHSIDLGLLTCVMCGKFKTLSPMRLLTHMAIHNEEKPFMCSLCGKTFKQLSGLNYHMIIHKDRKELDHIPTWASQQQCKTCDKFFANSKCLKKHVQAVHDKFKPFICNVCGHKTARKAMLELHLRQHTGEKPHHCPVCNYKTGDHNCLRRHIMRHKGDMKYSCPHCDYQSIQSSAYKKHISRKHPGQGGTYFCTMCSYHTVNENAYFSHIREHEKAAKLDNGSTERASDNGENASNDNNMTKNMRNGYKSFNKIVNQIIEETEDEETQNCFLNGTDHSEDPIDTGGITIPAGFELIIQ